MEIDPSALGRMTYQTTAEDGQRTVTVTLAVSGTEIDDVLDVLEAGVKATGGTVMGSGVDEKTTREKKATIKKEKV